MSLADRVLDEGRREKVQRELGKRQAVKDAIIDAFEKAEKTGLKRPYDRALMVITSLKSAGFVIVRKKGA